MDTALFEPVEVTDMRVVAKAAIVVYREVATGRLWIDPDLSENPLFRLGDVKGDKGDKGDAGTNGADGAAGAKGDKGDAGTNGQNSNPAIKLTGETLNTSRAGVVNGLGIQSVVSAEPLIGSVVIFRGLLKLVNTANGGIAMQANIGGLVFTFPTQVANVGTQYLNYEVTVHVLSSNVGFAVVKQSLSVNGQWGNAGQANNAGQSGESSTNIALIQFRSPVTTAVTTLFAVTEIL